MNTKRTFKIFLLIILDILLSFIILWFTSDSMFNMTELTFISFLLLITLNLGIVNKSILKFLAAYALIICFFLGVDTLLAGKQEVVCGNLKSKELQLFHILNGTHHEDSGDESVQIKNCWKCKDIYVEFESIILFKRIVYTEFENPNVFKSRCLEKFNNGEGKIANTHNNK